MIPTLGRAVEEERPPRLEPASILVVEEALPVRLALLASLGKLGIAEDDVNVVTTPEEALAHFADAPPQVVFTELIGVHPEDGLEVVLEMLDKAPETKVVLVTAEPRDGPEVRAAIRAGVFAVVEKPVRHEKIRQVMQDLSNEEGNVERMR